MPHNIPTSIASGLPSSISDYTGPAGALAVDTTSTHFTVRVQDGITKGGHPIVKIDGNPQINGVKTFVTAPKVPTPAENDNSDKLASTEYVDRAVANTEVPVASTTVHGIARAGTGLEIVDGILRVATS